MNVINGNGVCRTWHWFNENTVLKTSTLMSQHSCSCNYEL